MIRRTFFLFAFLCFTNFSICYGEPYYNSFTYYQDSIEAEENKFLAGEQNFFEQLTLVRKMHDIVLDFLNTAKEENFYEQMKLSKSYLDLMERINTQLFSQVYPIRYCDRRSIELDGKPTEIYYNTYLKKMVLTDEQRTTLYEEELERHKNAELLPKQLLDKETIKNLFAGQTYNFVLTLNKEVFFSYDQHYRFRPKSSKSFRLSPNHTLLAGNAPVITAGAINFYKVGQKELFVISCSSGHFQPMPESLTHMKNYLMALGIPEEAIISFALSNKRIDKQLAKIEYSNPEAQPE